MQLTEHTLLSRPEFYQQMEGLLASERAVSQAFGSLVRYTVYVTCNETNGKITADDVAYQLSQGLEGWVISVPNLAKELPTIKEKEFRAGIGPKTITAFEALIENLETNA